ncbi:MAG: hypothetical protein ACPG32_02850 [Akkermansiaceae bacterium]
MAATSEKKRKWMGLVCPLCRFVFRVPRDHEGQGAVCPACHYLLNLPDTNNPISTTSAAQLRDPSIEPKAVIPVPRHSKENEAVEAKPILSRALTESDKASSSLEGQASAPVYASPTPSKAPRERVRKKRSSEKEAPSWDSAGSSSSSRQGGAKSSTWILIASLLGVSVLVIGAVVVVKNMSSDQKQTQQPEDNFADLPAAFTPSLEELTDEEKKAQKEIEDSVKTGMNVLEESEKVVRKFFAATSPEEMIKLVRTPDVTAPRIKKWYAEHGWKQLGVKEIGLGGRITVKGKMASLSVRLDDYSVKQIALERVEGDYKVDWESWVIWTSRPWNKLFTERPQEPEEIRAQCKITQYYNRQFDDEQKWVCVELHYSPEHRILYGYIDKNDPKFTRLIGDLSARRSQAITVKIKYPKNPVAANQVQIVEYLQSGWVRPSEDESAKSTEK